VTADGFEATFGVNHLGHFVLVNELLPILIPPARICRCRQRSSRPGKQLGFTCSGLE
jgi:NAD(P)-dependent dehydrogenase (short-subunit alcohol dehydrogenase family)